MIKARVKELQNHLDENSAMLITSVPNRFYFTGFETSSGIVLITKKNSYFLIDFRYVEKAKQTVDSCKVILSTYANSEIAQLCKADVVSKLYVEANYVSVKAMQDYKENLKELDVIGDNRMDSIIEDMRAIKTDKELEYIRAAQKMTDETFSYILERIEPGRTEIDVMLDMEFYMRKLGSEGVSFDFIVVSGKNSSLPHGVPSDKKIEKGDFVTMDFGAVVNGYHSDMTRTVAIGQVDDEQKKIYNTVLKAQTSAINVIKAGIICKDVDKVARDIIYNAGYEGCFGHGLGHSVGIEIHESPAFNTRCETVLKSGMVMTVEPGIYIENKYGVRIEDMVYVTEKGCIDITNSKKELMIL